MKELNHSPIGAFKSVENNIKIVLLIYIGAKWEKKKGGGSMDLFVFQHDASCHKLIQDFWLFITVSLTQAVHKPEEQKW